MFSSKEERRILSLLQTFLKVARTRDNGPERHLSFDTLLHVFAAGVQSPSLIPELLRQKIRIEVAAIPFEA